jgi:hypothetical protein
MTKNQKLKSEIIAALTKLSQLGWNQSHREAWQPLEDEFNRISMTGERR